MGGLNSKIRASLLLSTNTYAALVLPDGDELTLLRRLRQNGDGRAANHDA